MKDELDYSITKLKKAYRKLSSGIKLTKDELDRDGVIQRFEFTFELLWKALKIYLENQGIIVKTPRDSFAQAFRINIISDEKIFLDMLEDRNNASHIYDEETSKKIFNRIKENYELKIKEVLIFLEKYLKIIAQEKKQG
jgi:nucleotidyltransferase substrate binding protein (TIGR01987 family)